MLGMGSADSIDVTTGNIEMTFDDGIDNVELTSLVESSSLQFSSGFADTADDDADILASIHSRDVSQSIGSSQTLLAHYKVTITCQ